MTASSHSVTPLSRWIHLNEWDTYSCGGGGGTKKFGEVLLLRRHRRKAGSEFVERPRTTMGEAREIDCGHGTQTMTWRV